MRRNEVHLAVGVALEAEGRGPLVVGVLHPVAAPRREGRDGCVEDGRVGLGVARDAGDVGDRLGCAVAIGAAEGGVLGSGDREEREVVVRGEAA